MSKSTRLDETRLGNIAYTAYLHGRIAGAATPCSPLRDKLARRYAEPHQSPVEPLAYLIGLRDHDGVIKSPSALLEVAHNVLELAEAKPVRRKRRPDTRWSAQS